MISCGALAAYVECQDENGVWSALPEYRVTTPDTKTASCFIESKAGSPFRVNYYEVHKMAQYDTIVRVFVDGKEMSAYIHGRAHPCGPNSCKTIEGVRSDARSLLPFKFAKLTLTDDDDIATKDEQVVKHVGSIMVKLFRAIQGPAGTNVYNGTAAIQSHVLHERAKKATLDHSTAFGQAKTVAVGYLHWFKYRSGDLLESDGIKPPVPGARDVSGEPAAEASGPNAKRQATSASRTPVDIDDSNDDRNASKKVKREKKKPVTAGRVIDIDDDDEETEIQKLRRENEQLRQKVKVEGKASSSKKGEVIDID